MNKQDDTCGCLAPDGGQIRYGTLLRPTSGLLADALRSYAVAEQVYGFHSANVYPPHVSLVGSIAPSVSEDVIVNAIADSLRGRRPVCLASDGLRLDGGAIQYQFSDADASAKEQGRGVADLMGGILDAVSGLRHFHDGDLTAAMRRLDSPERFRPHLSIVSFDGAKTPELSAEMLELLLEMGFGGPVVETFDLVHLLRFHALDWSGSYWATMTWSIVKTWRLESGSE